SFSVIAARQLTSAHRRLFFRPGRRFRTRRAISSWRTPITARRQSGPEEALRFVFVGATTHTLFSPITHVRGCSKHSRKRAASLSDTSVSDEAVEQAHEADGALGGFARQQKPGLSRLVRHASRCGAPRRSLCAVFDRRSRTE